MTSNGTTHHSQLSKWRTYESLERIQESEVPILEHEKQWKLCCVMNGRHFSTEEDHVHIVGLDDDQAGFDTCDRYVTGRASCSTHKRIGGMINMMPINVSEPVSYQTTSTGVGGINSLINISGCEGNGEMLNALALIAPEPASDHQPITWEKCVKSGLVNKLQDLGFEISRIKDVVVPRLDPEWHRLPTVGQIV